MPLYNGEKLNRVEELKNKLFSRDYEMKTGHRDNFTHPNKKSVPDAWADATDDHPFAEKFFMKTSIFKKFFVFSSVFFLLAMAYAAYTFFVGGNTVSSDNIEISVLGNSFTAGGEELSLIVGIVNKNNSSLDLVDLVVEYPKSSSGDLSGDTERLRETLGTIPAGGLRNENVKLVLFGEQGSVRPIKISLEYRVEGSNAIFVKEKIHEVSINSTPINLSLEAPSSISPNQDIALTIKAALNSTRPTPDIIIKVDYPVGFQFISAKPAPALGNNIWDLGDLAPGSERTIAIEGKMIDVFDGEEKTFRVWSGIQSETNKSNVEVVFNSLSHTVNISKPFIEARLFINDLYQSAYSVDAKNEITGEINWANNLNTAINDMEIRAKISGNAIDRKTIRAERGFYNSLQDEIIWSKSSNTEFKEVGPGDSDVVTFSFSPLPLFSASGGMLSDPSVQVDVSISGQQELSGFSNEKLTNSESKIIRIISDVGLAAKMLYYSGVFTNTGPIPPKVGAATTYTVVWTLSNTSNNISKAQVRATLPSWVRFAEKSAPASEDLAYNSFTKEIIWNVGNIRKGAGITEADREVSFQISFSPSLSQVDTVPTLINDAVLTGHDDFANVDVRVNRGSLSTDLNNDPAFPDDGARVEE